MALKGPSSIGASNTYPPYGVADTSPGVSFPPSDPYEMHIGDTPPSSPGAQTTPTKPAMTEDDAAKEIAQYISHVAHDNIPAIRSAKLADYFIALYGPHGGGFTAESHESCH